MSGAIQPLDGDWPGVQLSQDGTVLTVTIDRPAAQRRARCGNHAEPHRNRAPRAPQQQAVILTGRADYFSAGVDLQMSSSRNASEASLLELRSAVAAGPDMPGLGRDRGDRLSAIEGFCVGGAFALALACDFRIMGEGAFVRLPEVPLGMNMSWRTLPRLTTSRPGAGRQGRAVWRPGRCRTLPSNGASRKWPARKARPWPGAGRAHRVVSGEVGGTPVRTRCCQMT